MGLIDDINNDANFPKAARAWCSVCTSLKKMTPEEREAVQARFDDNSISHIKLSEVLRKNGYDLSDSVIGRHRRKVCKGVAK